MNRFKNARDFFSTRNPHTLISSLADPTLRKRKITGMELTYDRAQPWEGGLLDPALFGTSTKPLWATVAVPSGVLFPALAEPIAALLSCTPEEVLGVARVQAWLHEGSVTWSPNQTSLADVIEKMDEAVRVSVQKNTGASAVRRALSALPTDIQNSCQEEHGCRPEQLIFDVFPVPPVHERPMLERAGGLQIANTDTKALQALSDATNDYWLDSPHQPRYQLQAFARIQKAAEAIISGFTEGWTDLPSVSGPQSRTARTHPIKLYSRPDAERDVSFRRMPETFEHGAPVGCAFMGERRLVLDYASFSAHIELDSGRIHSHWPTPNVTLMGVCDPVGAIAQYKPDGRHLRDVSQGTWMDGEAPERFPTLYFGEALEEAYVEHARIQSGGRLWGLYDYPVFWAVSADGCFVWSHDKEHLGGLHNTRGELLLEQGAACPRQAWYDEDDEAPAPSPLKTLPPLPHWARTEHLTQTCFDEAREAFSRHFEEHPEEAATSPIDLERLERDLLLGHPEALYPLARGALHTHDKKRLALAFEHHLRRQHAMLSPAFTLHPDNMWFIADGPWLSLDFNYIQLPGGLTTAAFTHNAQRMALCGPFELHILSLETTQPRLLQSFDLSPLASLAGRCIGFPCSSPDPLAYMMYAAVMLEGTLTTALEKHSSAESLLERVLENSNNINRYVKGREQQLEAAQHVLELASTNTPLAAWLQDEPALLSLLRV